MNYEQLFNNYYLKVDNNEDTNSFFSKDEVKKMDEIIVVVGNKSFIPLNERNDGIIEKLDNLLNIVDINGTNPDKTEWHDIPAYIATISLDWFMLEWLFKNGADPYLIIPSESDKEDKCLYEFLLDELDLIMLDCWYDERAKVILNVATEIAKVVNKDYDGACYEINSKERRVSSKGRPWKY